MSEPLKIYRRGGGLVENPDPVLLAAAERALAVHRRDGCLWIEFVPPQPMPHYDPAREYTLAASIPIYRIENPDFRTYP